MKKQVSYDSVLDIVLIQKIYKVIKKNSCHKDKFFDFELFLTSNLFTILLVLRNKCYRHGEYNIFLITDPKYRVIMSEKLSDKIINHLFSQYILFPVLEKKMIPMSVATRENKGTGLGIYYMKRYINCLKLKYSKFYVLKCDVHKFFYSIDHEILLKKLERIYEDEDILMILREIINSTDQKYVNEKIEKEIVRQITIIKTSKMSILEKERRIKELRKIPRYQFGKGIPIGNMSSQILATFYLNEIDHFIKEKLHIKYYIRYMDDLVLFHEDREYLQFCLTKIASLMEGVKLHLNHKTQIVEIHQGVSFLGYRFVLKEQKLVVKVSRNIKKKLVSQSKKMTCLECEEMIKKYRGYLKEADCRQLINRLRYYSRSYEKKKVSIQFENNMI